MGKRGPKPQHVEPRICQSCLKTFTPTLARVKNGIGYFCSHSCSGRARMGFKLVRRKPKLGKLISCVVCGKEKYMFPSKIKNGYKCCSSSCAGKSRIGIKRFPFSDQHRKLISDNHHSVSGCNNPNWRGGITKKSLKWRNANWKRLKLWRNMVLSRDNFQCKECGDKNNLEAHHIIAVKEYRALAFLKMNGVTLCKMCHKKTDNYGGRNGSPVNKIFNSGGSVKFLTATIPHLWQEYNTVGNYSISENGTIVIFVSDMHNSDYNFLVTIHEFLESYLCKRSGIKIRDIDEFDREFERERIAGLHRSDDEPGHDPRAPYGWAHKFAEKIERQLAKKLHVSWNFYAKSVEALLPVAKNVKTV